VSDDLFSRDEVLAGHPGRQAHRALFLIESRTAHLAAHSRQAMELIASATATRERDLAFLEAFTLGHDPPLKPTIQDLERFAGKWADLVPAGAGVRAALAHILHEKYRFTRRAVPGIRTALGLDSSEVQGAYERLYNAPLGEIYAPRPSALHIPGWTGVRIAQWVESLPPFWTAYSLSVTETIGTAILALPIAVASVGPVAGLIVLLLIGTVTTITLVSTSEAVARSGSVRYGDAYFGRIVADYLGAPAAFIVSGALTLFVLVFLVSLYTGVGATLSSATSIPPTVGAALLFAGVFFLLSRRTLAATVSSALVTGAASIALILLMAVLALPHVSLSRLQYSDVPLFNGHPFHASILQLIFGVGLAAYFGHVSVGNCARVVLRADASARSLIWGSIAAQVTAAAVYTLWVLAVTGAVPHQNLASATGTAISPLADVAGPAVLLVGAAYVVVGLGISAVHYSYALRNLAREWLPVRSVTVLTLARERGRLLFGALHGSRSVDLVYLGLRGGHPAFRLETQSPSGTRQVDTLVDGRCDLRVETGRLDPTARGVADAHLEVLEADDEYARIRVSASEPPAYDGDWTANAAGLGGILDLPERDRKLFQWILRRGSVTLADVSAHSGQTDADARGTLQSMVRQGALLEIPTAEGPSYRPRIARKRESRLSGQIWDALADLSAPAAPMDNAASASSAVRRFRNWLLTEPGRSWLALTPLVAVFLVTEWLIAAGKSSFAGPLDFIGVVTVSVLAGMFPVLLLLTSRRKGEYIPGLVFRVLGYPPVAAAIYVIFLANLVAHGLILWQDPVERACALVVAVLVVVVTVLVIRRGAFHRRMVIELRGDPGGTGAQVSLVASGRPLTAHITLDYGGTAHSIHAATSSIPDLGDLRSATFALPPHEAAELEFWAHRVFEPGASEPMAGSVEVRCGDEVRHFDVQAAGGRIFAPIPDGGCLVTFTMPAPAEIEPALPGRRGRAIKDLSL
jgi:amino acid permease